MSVRLARLAAATVLATGLATFAFAAPARAEGEVDVNISGLSSSMEPGDDDSFNVRLRNRTDRAFTPVRLLFTIRLDGLQREHVRISGQLGPFRDAGSSTGEVRLTEPVGGRFLNQQNRRGSSVTVRLQFDLADSAPGGQARITVQAVANGQVLGTDDDDLRIRGEAAPATTTTEPPNTGPTLEPGPTLATLPANPTAANPTGGGPPAILYVLGGLLVLAGGAMLWLLFRRPRPALVEGAPVPYDTGPIGGPSRLTHPVYPPPPGPMPRRATPPTATPPTAVMPTVNPTHAPQHRAVDPWADSAEDQFPR